MVGDTVGDSEYDNGDTVGDGEGDNGDTVGDGERDNGFMETRLETVNAIAGTRLETANVLNYEDGNAGDKNDDDDAEIRHGTRGRILQTIRHHYQDDLTHGLSKFRTVLFPTKLRSHNS
jgi:hypothetical protein